MADSTSDSPATPPAVVEPPRSEHATGRGRYLLVELVIVTAGVLIALSVDSLREWSQHRSLVTEARRNITQEIQENSRSIEATLKDTSVRQSEIDNALTLANELLTTKKSAIREIQLNSSFLDVSDANWRSAERTGALGHMDYSEVQRYSQLYDVQALYSEHRRRQLERIASTLGTIDGDPYKARSRDLELFRERLLAMRSDLFISEKLARGLLDAYRRALEVK